MAEQDISARIGDAVPDGAAETLQPGAAVDTSSTGAAGADIDGGSAVAAATRASEPFRVGASFPAPSPLRSTEPFRVNVASTGRVTSTASVPMPVPMPVPASVSGSASVVSGSSVSGSSRLTSPSSPPGSFPVPRAPMTSTGSSAAESLGAADVAPSRAARSAGRAAHHHAAAEAPGAARLLTAINGLFTVLGTIVAAGSLFGADRVHGAARTLSIVAAGIAAAAVTVAVGVLLSRLMTTYGTQGRARRVERRPSAAAVSAVPGVLLLMASVVLGTAAAVAIIGPGDDGVPRLELAASTADDGRSGVSAEVTIADGTAGDPIAVSLSTVGDPVTVLSSQVRRASGNATDVVKVGGTVRDAKSVQVDVSLVGRRCRAVIEIRAAILAEQTRLTCRSV